MSRRQLLATFAREEDLLEATLAARASGLTIRDAYTPYAVHGLAEAMDLPPSRLPWVCFALGLFGAAAKVWFEYWTTGVDWPVNVGGKPWNSLPAFVPVTFEVMVLFAGLSTVAAFLLVARLWPGKPAVPPQAGVTNDRFLLIVEERDATFDRGQVQALFGQCHALTVEERIEAEGR